jgi:hypothetical protein
MSTRRSQSSRSALSKSDTFIVNNLKDLIKEREECFKRRNDIKKNIFTPSKLIDSEHQKINGFSKKRS